MLDDIEPSPRPSQEQQDDPRRQVAITLPVGAWQIILGCVAKAPLPWETSDPLLRFMRHQLTEQSQQ